MKIETERLHIRDIEIEDLKDFHNLCTNNKVTKYLSYIKTCNIEETKRWIRQRINWNNTNPRTSYNFSILLKESKQFIGWFGIGETEESKKGDMDFGYAILPKFQGKGYAGEVLKEIINFCFTTLEVNKIFGDCDKNNIASRKVMEKCGLRFEKEESGKVYLSISKNS